MKNALIGILVVCVLALTVVVGNLYYNLNANEIAVEEQDTKVQELENKVAELESKISQKDVIETEENNVELEEIPIGNVSKQKFKICTDHNTCYYSKEESLQSDEDLGIKINISNKKAYITIDVQNENLQTMVDSGDLAKLKNVKNEEIIEFSAEPIQVYYGEFGQDIVGREILFLMNDGTVEHIKVMNMLENQNYKSAGKIKRLSDIKQFDVLAVSDTEGGGYVTTIAIDKDGYYYDLNELL